MDRRYFISRLALTCSATAAGVTSCVGEESSSQAAGSIVNLNLEASLPQIHDQIERFRIRLGAQSFMAKGSTLTAEVKGVQYQINLKIS